MSPRSLFSAPAPAAAQSAIRAGYAPWCIDLFGDRDLRAVAPALRCPMAGYPQAMLGLLKSAPEAPVLLTGALENYPELIEVIAARRPLLGSNAAAVRRWRHPRVLAELPEVEGLRVCSVWLAGEAPGAVRVPGESTFLLKPLAGGAGRGIRRWTRGKRATVPVGYGVQRFIQGTPLGALYTASENGVRLLGVTEQIVGDSALGAKQFHYAGSIGPIELTARQSSVLEHVGEAATRVCGLRELFGVDLICDRQGDLWPIEINPRYTASAEVVEAMTGVAVLGAGLGEKSADMGRSGMVYGKAIVFARRACRVADLYLWFAPGQIADVPEIGEEIPANRPICTFFATGRERSQCVAKLHEMAEQLYTRLKQ